MYKICSKYYYYSIFVLWFALSVAQGKDNIIVNMEHEVTMKYFSCFNWYFQGTIKIKSTSALFSNAFRLLSYDEKTVLKNFSNFAFTWHFQFASSNLELLFIADVHNFALLKRFLLFYCIIFPFYYIILNLYIHFIKKKFKLSNVK